MTWSSAPLGVGDVVVLFFFFKQKTAYEMLRSLVGSEMCIRDRCVLDGLAPTDASDLSESAAGLAGAALVPTLVALIANHYSGQQQAAALGWLGSARAMAGVLAFLIIGTMERFVSWRVAFALLVVPAAAILFLSFKLKPAVAKGFSEQVERMLALYAREVIEVQYNLLSSHDEPRFLTMVSGDKRRLQLATLFQMCYPGAPSVYYGDEIGLQGGAGFGINRQPREPGGIDAGGGRLAGGGSWQLRLDRGGGPRGLQAGIKG